ncbi:ATP synthase [Salix suchowensis]|nr:ATP synthase [Salix suchowensis]
MRLLADCLMGRSANHISCFPLNLEFAPIKFFLSLFYHLHKKFDTAIGVFRKEKIIIDPEDPAAVSHYAKVMKTAREKIQYTIEEETKDIPDARTYLLQLQEIRIKGYDDGCIGKVEKEIKKPLMRNDKKGMALLMAEFDKINTKLGVRREDLPKYEEELELKIAKAQLEELRRMLLRQWKHKGRGILEEFKEEKPVDVRSLDIRNFL